MFEKRDDIKDEDYEKLLEVFGRLSPMKAWSKVKREDFTIRRFSSGFVNEIACCELTPEAIKRLIKNDREPKGVVVKFYPEEFFFKVSMWEKAANHQLLSDQGLSPKLYFLDDKCMIHEYVDSRNYAHSDDLNPETVKELARVLGKFHSVDAPISNVEFLKWNKIMESFNDDSEQSTMMREKAYLKMIKEDEDKSIQEKYYSLMTEISMPGLEKFIKVIRTECPSPLVFSHSDFNRGNRIITKRADKDGNIVSRVQLVDFDYSTTSYRGTDLGRFFSNYKHIDDNFGNEPFPSDDDMRLFLEEYRAECASIQGKSYVEDPINSIEQMVKESKLYALTAIFVDFWFCLLMYCRDPKSPKKIYFLDGAKDRYLMFKTLVEQCKSEGIIPKDLTWIE